MSHAQWYAVRTQVFKNKFGDWEKIERIKNSEDIEISGKEISETTDLNVFKKEALKYGFELRKEQKYKNQDKGFEISIGRSSIVEVVRHDFNLAHFQSIAAIPQIIEKSVYLTEKPNEDIKKHPEIQIYEYYICGLKIPEPEIQIKKLITP